MPFTNYVFFLVSFLCNAMVTDISGYLQYLYMLKNYYENMYSILYLIKLLYYFIQIVHYTRWVWGNLLTESRWYKSPRGSQNTVETLSFQLFQNYDCWKKMHQKCVTSEKTQISDVFVNPTHKISTCLERADEFL